MNETSRPSEIKWVKDLEKLPVISREQLVKLEMENPPYAGLCAKDMETDRIFTSPGPVYEPHLTEKDPIWGRGYYAAGFRKGDIVLNAFSYHMVAAGLTFHSGLRRVGATVIPSGASTTENQIQLIRDLGATGYTGTPSFLMGIIKKAEEMGYKFKDQFKIRKASFVAEPLQPSLRERFEKEYAIDTYQMYGATEVGDIAYECSQKNGWHICEEVIVEIVDPSTGKQLGPGELGEVVVTRLNPIFFLFRFGTGDLSKFVKDRCPCGRTSFRMMGISGSPEGIMRSTHFMARLSCPWSCWLPGGGGAAFFGAQAASATEDASSFWGEYGAGAVGAGRLATTTEPPALSSTTSAAADPSVLELGWHGPSTPPGQSVMAAGLQPRRPRPSSAAPRAGA